MTKHYCDRCKMEIEKEWVYRVTYESLYSGINATHINYELCERCSEALRKWIEGESADEEVESKIKEQMQEMLINNFNKWVRE